MKTLYLSRHLHLSTLIKITLTLSISMIFLASTDTARVAEAQTRTGVIFEKTFEDPEDNLNGFYTYNDMDKMNVVSQIDPVETTGHRYPDYKDNIKYGSKAAYFWVNHFVSEYNYRVMVQVYEDDQRTFSNQPAAHHLPYGETTWIGISMYFPTYYNKALGNEITHDHDGEIFWQFQSHEPEIENGKEIWRPYMTAEIDDQTYTGDPTKPYLLILNRVSGTDAHIPLPLGKWTDFVIEMKPHTSNGVFRVWVDGVKVIDDTGRPTAKVAAPLYHTFGIYKWHFKPESQGGDEPYPDESPHRDIWIDEYRIGDSTASYDSVAPGDGTARPGTPPPLPPPDDGPPLPPVETTVECVGDGLAKYAGYVLDNVGQLDHVKLATPTFNLSHPEMQNLVKVFAPALNTYGHYMYQFDAISGTAYNVYTPTGDLKADIMHWVGMLRGTRTDVEERPVMLTEIGWIEENSAGGALSATSREKALSDLKTQINLLKGFNGGTGQPNILTGMLFNVFYFPDRDPPALNPQFVGHSLTDAEIQQVCSFDAGRTCEKIGANSAVFYQTPPRLEDFYDKASFFDMGYTIEIAPLDLEFDSVFQRVMSGIRAAHDRGITPVVRLGVQDDGGMFEPSLATGGSDTLVRFIQAIDNAVDKEVYVVAGPNEPLIECWATPQCGGCGHVGTGSGSTIELPYVYRDRQTVAEQDRAVMGYVKSSRTYYSSDANSTATTGLPVQNAAVCAYQGYNPIGYNTIGSTIQEFSGGALTDENGFYLLNTKLNTNSYINREVEDNLPNSNFLMFYCGNELKEIYLVNVANTLTTLGMSVPHRYKLAYYQTTGNSMDSEGNDFYQIAMPPLDVVINCDAEGVTAGDWGDHSAPEAPYCPTEAAYVHRTPAERLYCEQNILDVAETNVTKLSRLNPVFKLAFSPDSRFVNLEGIIDPNTDVEINRIPTTKPEGRSTPRNTFDPVFENTHAYCTVAGCLKEYATAPNSEAEKREQNLVDCDRLKFANQAVNDKGINSQQARGFAINLASPSYYMQTESQPASNAARYKLMEKEGVEVCRDDEGNIIHLNEIQPPRNWIPPEEYCEPEEPDCPYRLDSSYFPYERLFVIDLGNTAKVIDTVINDSYVPAEEVRQKPFDKQMAPNSGDPKDEGRGEATGYTAQQIGGVFGPHTSADVSSNYVNDTVQPPVDLIKAPNQLLGVPPGVIDPSNELELKEFAYDSPNAKAYTRVGLPQFLCQYSTLDSMRPVSDGSRNADPLGWFETMYDFFVEAVSGEEDDHDYYGLATDYYEGKYEEYYILGFFTRIWSYFVHMWDFLKASNEEPLVNDCGPPKEVVNGCIDTVEGYIGDNCEKKHEFVENCDPRSEDWCSCSWTDGRVFTQEHIEICASGEDETDVYGADCICSGTKEISYSLDYSCYGEVNTHELVNQVTLDYPYKNAGYGLEGFTFLLHTPSGAEPRLDMGKQCVVDTYATNTIERNSTSVRTVPGEEGGVEVFNGDPSASNPRTAEGGTTNCGKSVVPATDLLRQLVQTPDISL